MPPTLQCVGSFLYGTVTDGFSSSLFDRGRDNGIYYATPGFTVHHSITEVLLLDACIPGDYIRVGECVPFGIASRWLPEEKSRNYLVFSSTTMSSKLDSSTFHKEASVSSIQQPLKLL
ncbi:Hypothetical predicted protein [Octopus vulgaris]|uniref:Uncharacterized protein n=1 Tax=Octopus vulgaris TaxID=6645 RepID=A0AA36F4Y4_OCTVU|nr:Hypothetical predicted protein [Octopus vulgaris]